MSFLSSYRDWFEGALWYLFLIALPLQVRLILYYPGWVFQEWQAISLFGTDILFIGLVVMGARRFNIRLSLGEKWLISFVLVAMASIAQGQSRLVSWFHFIKLCEGILFYLYVSHYALKRFDLVRSCLALAFGGFFQSVIGIAQFVKQADIGLYWLGEGIIRSDMKGVAVFYNTYGERVMRAYGATPHPNVLAGYLLFALSATYTLWMYFYKNDQAFHRLVGGMYGVILWGLWLTFSRTAIGLWMGAGITIVGYAWWRLPDVWHRLRPLVLITGALGVVFCAYYWPEVAARSVVSRHEEAVELRTYFIEESVDAGWNWAGVGIGQFVPWLMEKNPGQPSWRYQPVHNVYLLVYSEIGLIGFGIFMGALVLLWRDFVRRARATPYLWFVAGYVGVVMVMAFFDHFLWTLQQGRFVWWGALALLSARAQADIDKI